MHKAILIVFFFFHAIPFVLAQGKVVRNPIVAYQTHSELSIDSLGLYADSTVVWFKVTNSLPKGGWFCADSSTVLEIPDQNSRLKIMSARCIPWCPNAYEFRGEDDELHFELVFPYLSDDPKAINIIEECDRACFVLEGIILDDKLNEDHRKFDEGVRLFVNNKLAEAYELFSDIIKDIPDEPTHIYGYSYLNLIRICWQRDSNLKAEQWIRRLKKSALPRKQYYLNTIEKEREQKRFF